MRIADAGGPMNFTPAWSHAAAKSAFSERNPYPGWIACAPLRFATSNIFPMLRYDSRAAAGPIAYASSAMRTCKESRSTSEYTATDAMPNSRQARITRTAISPRLAIRIFLKRAIDHQGAKAWNETMILNYQSG